MSPEPPAAGLLLLLDQLSERIAKGTAELLQGQAPSEAQASPWLSIERAAAYLDWPKQRLYKLSAQGAIPHYKQDGRLLFHKHELDHWLQQYAQAERSLT